MERHVIASGILGDDISSIEYVQHAGDDKGIVNAARVSFGNDNNIPFNEKDQRLLLYLLRHKHLSPFEHNIITYKITAPIYVQRQWFRHRIASYNEISGRYVQMADNIYIPRNFRKQSDSNRQASTDESVTGAEAIEAELVYENAWKVAYKSYKRLLELGVCREQARGLLPLALYTEYYASMNLRSWFNFIELRDHEGAQWETRQYAIAIREHLKTLFPVTMAAWEELHGRNR